MGKPYSYAEAMFIQLWLATTIVMTNSLAMWQLSWTFSDSI